jgi:hypothetical protein
MDGISGLRMRTGGLSALVMAVAIHGCQSHYLSIIVDQELFDLRCCLLSYFL